MYVESGSSSRSCSFCGFSLIKPYICSACKYTIYCSKACQESDWGCHKSICKLLKNSPNRLNPVTAFLLKIALQYGPLSTCALDNTPLFYCFAQNTNAADALTSYFATHTDSDLSRLLSSMLAWNPLLADLQPFISEPSATEISATILVRVRCTTVRRFFILVPLQLFLQDASLWERLTTDTVLSMSFVPQTFICTTSYCSLVEVLRPDHILTHRLATLPQFLFKVPSSIRDCNTAIIPNKYMPSLVYSRYIAKGPREQPPFEADSNSVSEKTDHVDPKLISSRDNAGLSNVRLCPLLLLPVFTCGKDSLKCVPNFKIRVDGLADLLNIKEKQIVDNISHAVEHRAVAACREFYVGSFSRFDTRDALGALLDSLTVPLTGISDQLQDTYAKINILSSPAISLTSSVMLFVGERVLGLLSDAGLCQNLFGDSAFAQTRFFCTHLAICDVVLFAVMVLRASVACRGKEYFTLQMGYATFMFLNTYLLELLEKTAPPPERASKDESDISATEVQRMRTACEKLMDTHKMAMAFGEEVYELGTVFRLSSCGIPDHGEMMQDIEHMISHLESRIDALESWL